MLLRINNIFQLPTSTILSCETEDSIPDRLAGQYDLRMSNELRQVLKIEGRVAVRQVNGEKTANIDIFTHDAVLLTPEEALTGTYSLQRTGTSA